jgi:hypothetical protein
VRKGPTARLVKASLDEEQTAATRLLKRVTDLAGSAWW